MRENLMQLRWIFANDLTQRRY